MNILKCKDTSRPGNDCYIYEKVVLVEQFDMFAIIVFVKYVGWCEDENIRIEHTFNNFESASKYFDDFVSIREK